MKYSNNTKRLQKQRGSVLFIMIMILLALTIITFMATNMGKTDMRISNAYVEQNKAFIKGEEMLSRLRYALEQIPLPEGISTSSNANKTDRPIWLTPNLASATGSSSSEPEFTDPLFAKDDSTDPYDGWSESKTLTCNDIATWMRDHAGLINATAAGKFEPLDCSEVDPQGVTRTVIELINRKQNEGDIDELRDTYYYRITIFAKGDNTGRALLQGITGIQYN